MLTKKKKERNPLKAFYQRILLILFVPLFFLSFPRTLFLSSLDGGWASCAGKDSDFFYVKKDRKGKYFFFSSLLQDCVSKNVNSGLFFGKEREKKVYFLWSLSLFFFFAMKLEKYERGSEWAFLLVIWRGYLSWIDKGLLT